MFTLTLAAWLPSDGFSGRMDAFTVRRVFLAYGRNGLNSDSRQKRHRCDTSRTWRRRPRPSLDDKGPADPFNSRMTAHRAKPSQQLHSRHRWADAMTEEADGP
jgi:hypothetical protein